MLKCDSVSTEDCWTDGAGHVPCHPGVTLAWWSIAQPMPEDQVVLSTEERQRACRFIVPGAAGRFIATRAGLRRRLARVLKTNPRELRFEYGPQGKPWLPAAPDLDFNVSHSGDWAVLAHSRQHCVGVDVEVLGGNRRIGTGMLHLALAPSEQTQLNALPLVEQRGAFMRYWTAKEAVMKMCGLGMQLPPTALQFDLKSLRFQLDSCWRAAVPIATEVQALQAPEGMMATLAIAVVKPPVREVSVATLASVANGKRRGRLEIAALPVA